MQENGDLDRIDALESTVQRDNRRQDQLIQEAQQWTNLQTTRFADLQTTSPWPNTDLSDFRPEDEWRRKLNDAQLANAELVDDPNVKLNGLEIDRKNWTQLYRIRTNHGPCNHILNKWNPTTDPSCDCGHPDQTIHHIVNECPNRKFDGGLREINELTDYAIRWIRELDLKL